MLNTSGEMLPFENANKAPASPAKKAEITNANQRNLKTGIPMACARTSVSLLARNIHPKGDCANFINIKTPIETRIKHNI